MGEGGRRGWPRFQKILLRFEANYVAPRPHLDGSAQPVFGHADFELLLERNRPLLLPLVLDQLLLGRLRFGSAEAIGGVSMLVEEWLVNT